MKKIGILSDTHGIIPRQVYSFFKDCDEIWHAGDMGPGVLEELMKFKPVRGVWGNVDGQDLRMEVPKVQVFMCEDCKVMMTHIGGYPQKYDSKMLPMIREEKPDIYVSGHSHILKVMWDEKFQLLHINPGAAGKYGFHKVCTLVRFVIDGKTPKDLEIMEFDKNPSQE